MEVARQDVEGLVEAREAYGDSWRAEGGFSAFFNIKRKIDRLVKLAGREPARSRDGAVQRERYDIFSQVMFDTCEGGEGTLDSIRDLRRYLMLAEAWLLEQGVELPRQRDNLSLDTRAVGGILHRLNIRISNRHLLRTEPKPDRERYQLGATLERIAKGTEQEHPFGFDPKMDAVGEGIEDPSKMPNDPSAPPCNGDVCLTPGLCLDARNCLRPISID